MTSKIHQNYIFCRYNVTHYISWFLITQNYMFCIWFDKHVLRFHDTKYSPKIHIYLIFNHLKLHFLENARLLFFVFSTKWTTRNFMTSKNKTKLFFDMVKNYWGFKIWKILFLYVKYPQFQYFGKLLLIARCFENE